METNQTAPKTIDECIAGCPPDVREILEKIRMTIRKAAPDAEEAIKQVTKSSLTTVPIIVTFGLIMLDVTSHSQSLVNSGLSYSIYSLASTTHASAAALMLWSGGTTVDSLRLSPHA